jgi:hypothetical protein
VRAKIVEKGEVRAKKVGKGEVIAKRVKGRGEVRAVRAKIVGQYALRKERGKFEGLEQEIQTRFLYSWHGLNILQGSLFLPIGYIYPEAVSL